MKLSIAFFPHNGMKIEIKRKKEKKTVSTYKHAWSPRAHGSGDLNSGTQTDQGFVH